MNMPVMTLPDRNRTRSADKDAVTASISTAVSH
jgi:hypothetical protein